MNAMTVKTERKKPQNFLPEGRIERKGKSRRKKVFCRCKIQGRRRKRKE